jgi:hypothetical protein
MMDSEAAAFFEQWTTKQKAMMSNTPDITNGPPNRRP